MIDSDYIFKNVIPIGFNGGTGGTFLCNFLTSAKLNIKELYEFGKYGSMHRHTHQLEIPIHAHGHRDPFIDKINYIKSFKFNSNPPFFTTMHYTIHQQCLEMLNDNFEKHICINYNENDCMDIAAVHVSKSIFEEKDYNIQNFKQLIQTHSRLNKFLVTSYIEIKSDRVCNITWDDIIRNDPDILISKLSNFTAIPKENFFIDNVINWRKKTIQGLLEFEYVIR